MSYRPILPDEPPTPGDLAERDEFQQLVGDSLPRVQASAEKWRTGLAAFITLVTTGLVIKGRDVTSGVPTGWRIAITACVAVGLMLSVVGLWQALAAQAGGRLLSLTLDDIRRDHGSVRAFRVATAVKAAHRLDLARRSVCTGLLFLLTGVGLTWWAPPVTATPSYLRVEQGHDTTCGTLTAGDGHTLKLIVFGQDTMETIPVSSITSIAAVTSC